jgi:SAM-dependent methyltransferase
MGFNNRGAELLLFAKSKGVDFHKTVTIGRQGLHLSQDALQQSLLKYGYKETSAKSLLLAKNGYAESFLSLLGAEVTDSIDASNYEAASIIHDMNTPIPTVHKGKYTTVIDGGSLEHIFNFPVAVKNCMELVKPGGYYLGITPANNFFGHGFYQFSPELYFRIFSPENGFQIEKILFYADQKNAVWYEVSDPNDVKSRVILSNRFPSNLFVLAKKITDTAVFSTIPQQSDYQHMLWEGKGNVNQVEHNQKAISITTKFANLFSQVKILFSSLGSANKLFFKKLGKKARP